MLSGSCAGDLLHHACEGLFVHSGPTEQGVLEIWCGAVCGAGVYLADSLVKCIRQFWKESVESHGTQADAVCRRDWDNGQAFQDVGADESMMAP